MSSDRPVVAVLTARWERVTEAGWITRQVAGALATVADVHVVTPDGSDGPERHDGTGGRVDSVFTVHRTGVPLRRVDERRRELLVEALAGATDVDPALGPVLDDGLLGPWEPATGLLDGIGPDLVVIAGHHELGALRALERSARPVPYVVLAHGIAAAGPEPRHFDPLVGGARAVLVVTGREADALAAAGTPGPPVHRIGAPLAANPSVRSEPNTWVGDTGYVLVLTGVPSDDQGAEGDLARLVRLGFPGRPVGISHTDAFTAWHHGRSSSGWPIEGSSDLHRLLAFARVTVDLHPAPFFGRRVLESLLYGAPVVVPAASAASDHARRGRGGLWFHDPAELLSCVDALLDDDTHDALADQGRTYAEAEYGSTAGFVARVLDACRLAGVPA